MNNILIGIKNFFKNKNVVTVIGIIAILGLLYFGYNSTVKSQTNPIRVPVAKTTIQPRTLITDDMITYISIPSVAVSQNVKRASGAIVGMYTDVNTVIPAGSMFYSDVLVTEKDLPDSAFVQVPEGQRPYSLAVTSQTTYGNSIFPGNVVDVYMKATDESGNVVVGRLLEKVTILAVKDNTGKNVFENTAESRIPATLLFGVPDDIYLLLKRAEYLKSQGVELFPVPYGGSAAITGALAKDRQELIDIINSHSTGYITIDDQNQGGVVTPETPETNPEVGE